MITFSNHYEIAAWIATIHAYCSGKNAINEQMASDAAKAGDLVVGMMRMRTPEGLLRSTTSGPPKPAVVVDNESEEKQAAQ